MKIVYKNQAKVFKNSNVCAAIEYPMGDKNINGTIIKLNGRYPDKGRVVNLECKELVYIVKGSGKITVESKEIKLEKGDLILIEPKEKYFWEGKFNMFVSCAPAWYPEQHKSVE